MAVVKTILEAIGRNLAHSADAGARKTAATLLNVSAPSNNVARSLFTSILGSNNPLRWDIGPEKAMLDNVDHFAPSMIRIFDKNGKFTQLCKMFQREYREMMNAGHVIETDTKLVPSELQNESGLVKRVTGQGALSDINIIIDERGAQSANPFSSVYMVVPKSRIANKIKELTESISTVSTIHESEDWNIVSKMLKTLYGKDPIYAASKGAN